MSVPASNVPRPLNCGTASTTWRLRPSFSSAAPPAQGAALFDYLVDQARARHPLVATGRFGADMQVALVNDGPVTIWIDSKMRDC